MEKYVQNICIAYLFIFIFAKCKENKIQPINNGKQS